MPRSLTCIAFALLLITGCTVGAPKTESPTGRASTLGLSTHDAIDSGVALTSPQVMERYRDSVKADAAASGIRNPPAVALIRFISPAELGQTMTACLSGKGIPATVVANGFGYQVGDFPSSQNQAANLAQFECSASYPIHPQYLLRKSHIALEREYHWMVSTQVPCYQAQGFSISQPPSMDVWIASYATGAWGPDLDVEKAIDHDASGWRTLNEACPAPRIEQFIEHPPKINK